MIYGKPIWEYKQSFRVIEEKRIIDVDLEFDDQSMQYVKQWIENCPNKKDFSRSVELRSLLNPFAKFYGVKLFSLQFYFQPPTIEFTSTIHFTIVEKRTTYLQGIQSAIADILTNK